MNNPPPRKSRKVLWLLVFFLGTPFLFCSGIATWWIGRNSIAQSKLDARLDDLQAAGKPIDEESLAVYYDSLTDPRNSEAWLAVIEVVDSESLNERTQDLPVIGLGPDIPPVGEPWPERQQVVELLTELRPSLDRVHQIAQANETVRFPRRWDSFETQLPSLMGLRQVARVLSLEHAVALRDGDAEVQHRVIQSMLGTHLAIRHDPLLVSSLVSVAIHGEALSPIQDSIELNQLTDEHLASLRARLELLDDFHTPYAEAVYGEMAMGLRAFHDPSKVSEFVDEPIDVTMLGSRAIDALNFIDIVTEIEEFRHDSLANWIADVDQQQKEFERNFGSNNPLDKIDRVLTSMFIPSMYATANAHARATMANRLAISAIALRQWERQHGSFPESLEQIATLGVKPEQLITIHGDRFGYQVSGNEATIWAYDPLSNDEDNQPLTHVPAEPPTEDAVNEFGNREAIRMWVWRLSGSE